MSPTELGFLSVSVGCRERGPFVPLRLPRRRPARMQTPTGSITPGATRANPGGVPGTPSSEGAEGSARVGLATAGEVGIACSKCGVSGGKVLAKIEKNSDKFDLIRSTTNPRCKSYDHVVCRRNYGALARKWAKDVAVRLWWESLTSQEHQSWYVQHHVVDEVSTVRPIIVERSERSVTGNKKSEEDVYVPFVVFERNGLLLGKSHNDIKSEWLAILADDSHPKVNKNGQIWVFDHTGVTVTRYDIEEAVRVQKDTKEVSDHSELATALRESKEAMAKFKRKREPRRSMAPSGMPRDANMMIRGATDIEDTLALADDLEIVLSNRAHEHEKTVEILQEIADMDDQAVEIFRLEQAAAIKGAAASSRNPDAEKKRAMGKFKSFWKGPFSTKVENLCVDATALVKHCEAEYKDMPEKSQEWKDRLVAVKEVPEAGEKVLNEFGEKVAGMLTTLEKGEGDVDDITEDFETERTAAYAEFKKLNEKVSKMTCLVKREEQAQRDNLGSGKKRRRPNADLPEGCPEGSGGGGWAVSLRFLHDTFAHTTPEVNLKALDQANFMKLFCIKRAPELAAELKGNPVVTALSKWTAEQCGGEQASAKAAAVSHANQRDKVEAIIAKHLAVPVEALFKKPCSFSDAWLAQIFNPQLVHFMPQHVSMSLAPYGLPMTLAIVSGVCIVGGFAVASLPGATLEAKTEHLKQLEADALAAMAQKPENFFCKLEPGACLHIPIGTLVLQFCTGQVDLLRWSSFDTGDVAAGTACVSMMSMILHSRPFLRRNELYNKFLAFLQARAQAL